MVPNPSPFLQTFILLQNLAEHIEGAWPQRAPFGLTLEMRYLFCTNLNLDLERQCVLRIKSRVNKRI